MNVQQLRAQIAALQDATMDDDKNFQTAYDEGKFDAFSAVDALLDSLQEEHLWKDAQGDDLPEIDREVVVLYQHYPLDVDEYSVGFAHRPPEYWDGKNIGTGVVTRYYPKKYGKGGWSSPDVKWWLDCDLPKMERYEDCYNEVIKSTQNGIGNTKY